MSWLSNEAENDLTIQVSSIVNKALENYIKPEPRLTGLITQSELKKELGIDYNTLAKYEANGLPRYIPPLENSRKVYYRVSDVLNFMGVK